MIYRDTMASSEQHLFSSSPPHSQVAVEANDGVVGAATSTSKRPAATSTSKRPIEEVEGAELGTGKQKQLRPRKGKGKGTATS